MQQFLKDISNWWWNTCSITLWRQIQRERRALVFYIGCGRREKYGSLREWWWIKITWIIQKNFRTADETNRQLSLEGNRNVKLFTGIGWEDQIDFPF